MGVQLLQIADLPESTSCHVKPNDVVNGSGADVGVVEYICLTVFMVNPYLFTTTSLFTKSPILISKKYSPGDQVCVAMSSLRWAIST